MNDSYQELAKRLSAGPVLALSGGVGGAKLALGLSRILKPGLLNVLVNTADDFKHLGLHVSPDLDTLLYTLAGINDPDRGWGRRDEAWSFMKALAEIGGDTWFQLGDQDLATNVERTHRLKNGCSLSDITDHFCAKLGVSTRLLPMSEDRVRTRIHTAEGWLDFQDYFVRRRCEPVVLDVAYEGATKARANPDALGILGDPQLRAIVICPSNPLLSVEPILAVPGYREALLASRAPIVAVSPIIGGNAVKGPTAKMLRELGLEASASSVCRRYEKFLDAYILDEVDRGQLDQCQPKVVVARTLMQTLADRETLARVTLNAADSAASVKWGKQHGVAS